DMRLENLLEVGLLDARVPDIVRVHDHHGSVAALGEATSLVDAHLGVLARGGGGGPERLDVLLDVALLRAGLAGGADEHVTAILAQWTPLAEKVEPAQPGDVVVESEHHEHHQQHEAYLLGNLPLADRDGPADHRLAGEEEQ